MHTIFNCKACGTDKCEESVGRQVPAVNTDRELWRKVPGNYYSPRIFVNAGDGIGIDVGGSVIVKSVEAWHELAEDSEGIERVREQRNEDIRTINSLLREVANLQSRLQTTTPPPSGRDEA